MLLSIDSQDILENLQDSAWYGFSEAYDAEELVVDRIGDGDGVRELIRCIDAVVMAGEALEYGACPARADGTVTKVEIVNNDMGKTAVVNTVRFMPRFSIPCRIIDYSQR
jgi:hypothetical protein